MRKIKIAIADDSDLLRNSISNALNQEKDFEVIFQAENGLELLEQLEKSSPDIVLMDIRMPVMDGIEVTKRVRDKLPNIKVIAFSLYDIESNIITMNIHGVKSFIRKDDGREELIRAIRIISEGGTYLTDYASEIIRKYITDNNYKSISTIEQKQYSEGELLMKLNDVERKILLYVADRLPMKKIAENLSLSPHTINNKQATIRRKFGLYGRGKIQEFAISFRNIFQKKPADRK
jgi:DNA-binding NarL/FixJ family response regulator